MTRPDKVLLFVFKYNDFIRVILMSAISPVFDLLYNLSFPILGVRKLAFIQGLDIDLLPCDLPLKDPTRDGRSFRLERTSPGTREHVFCMLEIPESVMIP